MMIGGIPWALSYVLVFTPPKVDPISGAWILVGWLIFTTCLFDTFNSIWWVNFYSLFPDKFRSLKERRIASAIVTPVGVVGITLGGIVPPLFITYGVPTSFIIQSGIVAIIGLVLLVLGIPGWRDDPQSVEAYLKSYEKELSEESSSFIKTMFSSLHQKSFLAFLLIYLGFQTLTFCVQSSIPYALRFVLKRPARDQLFLQIGFLIGAVLSAPLWIKLANRKNNNRQIYIISAVFLAVASIPLSFVLDYTIIFIIFIFWGVGLGGFWALNRVILSDAVDEAVVRTKKREEGIYTGIMMFFNRLAIIVQVIIFATVHTLTGFVEGADTQSAQAQIGIQLHWGLIPMIFMMITILIFWKLYDLKPSKVEVVQSQLKQLGI
jgi:GPH family glycoside/pentoside/hexuronide:cation symporter